MCSPGLKIMTEANLIHARIHVRFKINYSKKDTGVFRYKPLA